MMAVICGTPMPATTRVVQMEPGPMPTLTTSAPAMIRSWVACGGGDVAGDERQVGIGLFDGLHGGEHAGGVAVGGVEADGVHFGVDQRGDAVHHIAGDANGGGAEQAALAVLGGVGVLLGLLDVLDGDEAAQHVVFVHQRQFFDAVLGEDLARLLQRGAHRGGDEVFRGHDLGDLAGIVGLKAQVAVGEDADQLAVFGDGHAGDAVARHQFLRVGDEMIRGEEERIGDDAVFRALDLVHLRGLLARWTCSCG